MNDTDSLIADAPTATEAAPKKRAAKKTAAKKAAVKTARKTAAKRTADAAEAPVPAAAPAPVVVVEAPAPSAEAPVKKVARKAAKKAARKTADTISDGPAAEAPRVQPAPPPVAAPPAPPAPEPVREAPPRSETPAPQPAAAPREGAPHVSEGRPPRPPHAPQQGGGHPHARHQQPPQGDGSQQQGGGRFEKRNRRKRRRRGRDRDREPGGDMRDDRFADQPGGDWGDAPEGAENQARPGKPPFQQRPPRAEPPPGPVEPGSGLLEISGKGFGFLRQRHRNFAQSPHDIFITPETVRKYGLRDGVYLEGDVRNGFRGPQMIELRKINGREPEAYKNLPIFEELTAVNPSKRIVLETDPNRTTTRIIDMVAPIGRGQRGLIVAPPRTGKTTLLQHIAEAISTKYEDIHLIVLLVDERPEEVTEITRAIPQAEVYASSNDAEPKSHLRIAQIAIERAKRLVEAGEHVFIVLDSITRLARASNNAVRGVGSGRTMSGGIDARALEMPRRLFAAARNTREAGSLTIIATALIETNSKADELIFQEFKGTGNMELVLDRKIAHQYVYPAIDIFKSGTRREELLLPAHQLEKINLIRRGLAGHKPVEAVERLLHFVRRHPSNAQMLLDIPKAAFVD